MTQRHIRREQGGFTLLELLVVVGIMAAVAGTATLALQDTTARASAAAHVLMMDELNEGTRTFRVLNGNQYPNNFDSLLATDTPGDATAAVQFSNLGGANAGSSYNEAEGDLGLFALTAGLVGVLNDIGITELQYVDTSLDPADDGTCADVQALINSRGNAVVAGNLFLTPAANGCGFAATIAAGDQILLWAGGEERVTGQPVETGIVEYDGTNLASATSTAFMVVGFGTASTLFDGNTLGGMTSVPVYRHVAQDQYNRMLGLFEIGTFDGAGGITPVDQVSIVTVIDSAGDTKEEELGEWDGTRNTI
ncbi:MAG: type II secretion system protein [Pseudomonadota bacterium]